MPSLCRDLTFPAAKGSPNPSEFKLFQLFAGHVGAVSAGAREFVRPIHYFPLYAFDHHSSIVPNLVAQSQNRPLTFDNINDNSSLNELTLLSVFNPNRLEYFSKMWFIEKIFREADLPFINKTFYIYFDMISASDEASSFKLKKNFLEISILNHSDSANFAKFVINWEMDLQLTSVSPTVQAYSGEVKFSGIFFSSYAPIAFLPSLVVSVSPTQLSGPTFVNPDNLLRFSKTKYQNLGFYSLLQPQFVVFSVGHLTGRSKSGPPLGRSRWK